MFLSFFSLHDSNQDTWKYKFIDDNDNDNGDDDDDGNDDDENNRTLLFVLRNVEMPQRINATVVFVLSLY